MPVFFNFHNALADVQLSFNQLGIDGLRGLMLPLLVVLGNMPDQLLIRVVLA